MGPNGRVVSIDVDPNLTRRAQTLLDAGGVTNVTLLTRDGIAGASEHAPYTHLISWTTPPLLPVTWIEQMAVGAVLVLPLPLASVERSTAIVRVRVDHPYAPHAECVAPGAFIPMHSPDAPPNIRLHRDLAACTGDLDNERSVRWISSQALRGDAAAATRLLDLLTAAPLEPSPLLGTKTWARSAPTCSPPATRCSPRPTSAISATGSAPALLTARRLPARSGLGP